MPMAAVKRVVSTSFWTDNKVDDFTPEDKYFMLYLLTNPFTSQLGIYEISIKQAAFQLGYSVDAVKSLIDRFENKYGVIVFSKETNEIAIKNFLRHSIIKGGAPVRDCLIKEMKAVKNKTLIATVFSHIKGDEELNETVKGLVAEYEEKNGVLLYCNEKQNENENENDNEESYHESSTNRSYKVSEVTKAAIDYLNKKAGTAYKASSRTTKDLVSARMNEGFTEEDFYTVIDNKVEEWGKPPKPGAKDMRVYIRPGTLFGTKFEAYLNQRRVSNDGEHERIGEHLI